MKIEDLLNLKIDIQTKDDTSFLELAILFDKPEFLQMLPQFRKDYDIDELIDPDKFNDKINELESKTGTITFSKYRHAKELIKNSPNIDRKMDLYEMLDTEANLVCYQFKRPPCFVEAVKQAIFCGSVEEDWLGTTSIEVIESGIPLNASAFQLPQVAILISPTTTYKTLQSSFQVAQTMYKTNPKLSYFQPRVDFVKNIKQYRDWYWTRIEQKTYQVIADEWLEKHENENTTYLDVLKGVKIYKKLLSL